METPVVAASLSLAGWTWLSSLWWLLVATLVVARHPRSESRPGPMSALPLLLVGLHGAAALLAAVVVLATGALELGRPRRGFLLASFGLFALASAADAHSLALWVWLRATFWLGTDDASRLVDALPHAVRMVGVAAALGWATPLARRFRPARVSTP